MKNGQIVKIKSVFQIIFIYIQLKKWRWNKEEIEFIKNNYNKFSNIKLAEMIGREEQSVQHKLEELELKKIINWDKNSIINELQNINKKLNHFGSFNEAKKSAGLITYNRRWAEK